MKDLFDILLDKDNKDPILLTGEDGKTLAFEQVAIIPYVVNEDEVLYVVLHPISKIDGIAEDEAVVFKVVEDDRGVPTLCVEDNEIIAIEVFNRYYDMLEEANNIKQNQSAKKRKGDK